MGRGRDDIHPSRPHQAAPGPTVIQVDYMFGKLDASDTVATVLCAIDNCFHRSLATWVTRKGAQDDYVVNALKAYIVGLNVDRAELQCDPENGAGESLAQPLGEPTPPHG